MTFQSASIFIFIFFNNAIQCFTLYKKIKNMAIKKKKRKKERKKKKRKKKMAILGFGMSLLCRDAFVTWPLI
jgi:ATP/ADP translocase